MYIGEMGLLDSNQNQEENVSETKQILTLDWKFSHFCFMKLTNTFLKKKKKLTNTFDKYWKIFLSPSNKVIRSCFIRAYSWMMRVNMCAEDVFCIGIFITFNY